MNLAFAVLSMCKNSLFGNNNTYVTEVEKNSSSLRYLHCPGSSKSILDANILDSSESKMHAVKNAKLLRGWIIK